MPLIFSLPAYAMPSFLSPATLDDAFAFRFSRFRLSIDFDAAAISLMLSFRFSFVLRRRFHHAFHCILRYYCHSRH